MRHKNNKFNYLKGNNLTNKININEIVNIAVKAGKIIMGHYNASIDVTYKNDKSPLTNADISANIFICDSIASLYQDIPIVSEESINGLKDNKPDGVFWLIDPLDGTKEFISKNGEFTVNIALIENGIPILGVVHAPALDITYFAEKNNGAFMISNGFKTKINANSGKIFNDNISVVVSRSHLDDDTKKYIEYLKTKTKTLNFLELGSSLKICKVAEGVADVYPRFAPTMEWDTAAGHAIALESGVLLVGLNSQQSLAYGKSDRLNEYFICAPKAFFDFYG